MYIWTVVYKCKTIINIYNVDTYGRLFNVYMDGVVREVNVRVVGKELELLSANGGKFEINQLLFADDTALMADKEEKLCRLVSEFERVCKRRKLRVNAGKSKIMR